MYVFQFISEYKKGKKVAYVDYNIRTIPEKFAFLYFLWY